MPRQFVILVAWMSYEYQLLDKLHMGDWFCADSLLHDEIRHLLFANLGRDTGRRIKMRESMLRYGFAILGGHVQTLKRDAIYQTLILICVHTKLTAPQTDENITS